MVIDENHQVIAWNQAMEDLTGLPAEYMLGLGDYAYSVPFLGEKRPILDDYDSLPLSMIIGDVNGLKMVNDAFGHQTGDLM